MPKFFDPTPEQRGELEAIAAAIPGVQKTFVLNHPQVKTPDRGAHQQQIAASKVLLTVADRLPPELDGLGVFQHTGDDEPLVGIGRISTGLGCPHAETDADFLGLMVAFRTAAGRRIDLITINDSTSPTDTPEEFLALLQATADAAHATGLLATQATLLASLARHAGLGAVRIAAHVTAQTNRTVRSTSAYQQDLDGHRPGTGRAREVHLRAGGRCGTGRVTRSHPVHRRLACTAERRRFCRSISGGSRISTTAERQPRISPVRGPTITRSALGASPSRRPTSTRLSRS